MKIILISFALILKYGLSSCQTPPVPEGLSAEIYTKSNKQFIKLSWDPKHPQDTLTYGYLIHHNFPPDSILYQDNKINLITTNSYHYEIKKETSGIYIFAIKAVSGFENRKVSGLSEMVDIISPSKYLPTVAALQMKRTQNGFLLSWEYPEVPDLKHFSLLLNGKRIKSIAPSKRESNVELTLFERKNRVQLVAESQNGVMSKASKAVFFAQ